MSFHEFIFSNKPSHRYTRHMVFWLVWWLYFFGSQYFLPQPFRSWKTGYLEWGIPELARSFLMLSIHIFACYATIYFLMPRYLLKKRYFLFLAGLLLVGFIMAPASFFIDSVVMPAIEPINSNPPQQPLYSIKDYATLSAGVFHAVKIIAIAFVIKLAKHWWQKQKEKERLEKEKLDAELQLLKTQIHPGFLFNTLNNIHSFALTASPKAPEMLLKLSDILSYMLYECNDKEVWLEKEIKVLKDYLALEKMHYGDKLEMNMQVRGDTTKDKIAPLLLLRFIENSFKQCSNIMTAQPWINLDLLIEDHVLYMKLMNGKPAVEPIALHDEEDDVELAARQLQLIYPDSHELKITVEPEIMMISLRIRLDDFSGTLEIVNEAPAAMEM